MIGNSRFRDCVIANVDGEIKALESIFDFKDNKTNTEYYIYRDIISGQEGIAYNVSIISTISKYMDEKELNSYLIDKLSMPEQRDIIARALKHEIDELMKKNDTVKKILKP